MTIKELSYNITHINKDIKIAEEDLRSLTNIISWKQIPEFPRRGRMAWYLLKNPAQHKLLQNTPLSAAKIKGVGAYDPKKENYRDAIIAQSELGEIVQPTNLPLNSFATYPHLGFTNDGKFRVAYGSLSPVGGILHERAVREFELGNHLVKSGVISIVPLLVARYDDCQYFDEKPLGVVVSLLQNELPYRISEILYGGSLKPDTEVKKEDFYDLTRKALGVELAQNDKITRVHTVCQLAFRIGKGLRKFSESGLYRYSVEFANFDFDLLQKDVVFTDLDSAEYLSTLSKNLQPLQILRDIASMLYHTMAKFGNPSALGYYNIIDLSEIDPLKHCLTGYFENAEEIKVKSITKVLWRLFIPHLILMNKYQDQIRTDWSQERRRSYKMDHHLFFIAAMILVYPLYVASPLGQKFPFQNMNMDSLLENAKEFLGERFDYLKYVLDDESI